MNLSFSDPELALKLNQGPIDSQTAAYQSQSMPKSIAAIRF